MATTNLGLTQYIATDKIDFLTKYNGDMTKIDTAVGNNNTAIGDLETSILSMGGQITSLDTRVDTLETRDADYIVEIGGNANGKYEKWNSGKLIMYGIRTTDALTFTQSGALYLCSVITNLPYTSLTECIVNANLPNNNGVWSELSVGTLFLNSFGMYLYKLSSGNLSGLKVFWQAIGTWK